MIEHPSNTRFSGHENERGESQNRGLRNFAIRHGKNDRTTKNNTDVGFSSILGVGFQSLRAQLVASTSTRNFTNPQSIYQGFQLLRAIQRSVPRCLSSAEQLASTTTSCSALYSAVSTPTQRHRKPPVQTTNPPQKTNTCTHRFRGVGTPGAERITPRLVDDVFAGGSARFASCSANTVNTGRAGRPEKPAHHQPNQHTERSSGHGANTADSQRNSRAPTSG